MPTSAFLLQHLCHFLVSLPWASTHWCCFWNSTLNLKQGDPLMRHEGLLLFSDSSQDPSRWKASQLEPTAWILKIKKMVKIPKWSQLSRMNTSQLKYWRSMTAKWREMNASFAWINPRIPSSIHVVTNASAQRAETDSKKKPGTRSVPFVGIELRTSSESIIDQKRIKCFI